MFHVMSSAPEPVKLSSTKLKVSQGPGMVDENKNSMGSGGRMVTVMAEVSAQLVFGSAMSMTL